MSTNVLPADNLDQILRNFNPHLIIDEAYKDFYVDIFSAFLNKIKNSITRTGTDIQTYFITGQIGSGKTSSMYRLKRTLEELDKYKIVHIDSRDYDPQDVDIEDLLIITGFKILEIEGEEDTNLKKLFYQYLNDVQRVKQNEIEISEQEIRTRDIDGQAEIESGVKLPKFIDFVKLGVKAFAKIKYEKEFRSDVRRIFRLVKLELFDRILDLIRNFYHYHSEWKLVIIYDDTEKLRGDNAKNIFQENINFLINLNCTKIVLFPIKYYDNILSLKWTIPPIFFTLRITEPNKKSLDSTAKNNIKLLREIISKRINPEKLDELIEPEIVNNIIKNSGGNLRQLISLIYNAAIEALDDEKITSVHFNRALRTLRQTFSFTIREKIKIQLLTEIKESHYPNLDSNELSAFDELLHNNLIFFYYNDEMWYELNPLIEETVSKLRELD